MTGCVPPRVSSTPWSCGGTRRWPRPCGSCRPWPHRTRCGPASAATRRFAVTPGAGRAIMAAVEQLTFGNGPAAAPAAAGPAGPGYEIERELATAGAGCVAGVDEVGRGAWAGPVTVCAVIVRAGFPAPPAGLTDSKRLSPP